MRAALVIAAKDLRSRFRDRTFFIVAIVAPFGLAAVFGLLLPAEQTDFHADYAFVDLDGSDASAGFRTGALEALENAGIATVTDLESEPEARRAVESEDARAAAIVPAGFGAAVQSGQGATIRIIGDVDAELSTGILRSVAEAYARELQAVRLSVLLATGGAPPGDPAVIGDLVERALAEPSPIGLEDREAELKRMGSRTFYAASMAIFFLFFTAQFGVLSLLSERRQGTLPRLVAAPIRPAAIVAGKALGAFAMGLSAMAVLAVASSLILGADWGDPVGVALLILAAVIAVTGITALITTLARTEEQAGGWNSIVAVSLAILGGAFMDLSQGPAILSRLSFVTPHAWFLQGLDEMAAPTFTLADLVLPVAVLLAMGLVTGAVGLVRARSLVVAR